MNNNNFEGKVKVPVNLKNNKQTIIGKLDLRDLIYISISFGIAILIFVLLVFVAHMNEFVVFVIAVCLGFPIGIAGFIKWDGLNFEEWLLIQRVNTLNTKKVRINHSSNVYETYEDIINNELSKKKAKNKEKEKKK